MGYEHFEPMVCLKLESDRNLVSVSVTVPKLT